jgi:hypothetical protein
MELAGIDAHGKDPQSERGISRASALRASGRIQLVAESRRGSAGNSALQVSDWKPVAGDSTAWVGQRLPLPQPSFMPHTVRCVDKSYETLSNGLMPLKRRVSFSGCG